MYDSLFRLLGQNFSSLIKKAQFYFTHCTFDLTSQESANILVIISLSYLIFSKNRFVMIVAIAIDIPSAFYAKGFG